MSDFSQCFKASVGQHVVAQIRSPHPFDKDVFVPVEVYDIMPFGLAVEVMDHKGTCMPVSPSCILDPRQAKPDHAFIPPSYPEKSQQALIYGQLFGEFAEPETTYEAFIIQ